MEPLHWLSLWVLLNIGLTLLNKSVFYHAKFGYPLFLSGVHMAFNSLLSFAVIHYKRSPKTLPNPKLQKEVFALSFIFSLNVIFGNAGLKYSSVSLREVVRCLIPAITMLLSYWFLGKRYPLKIVMTLVPIMLGVAFSSSGDMEFSWFGLSVLLVSCFLAAGKGVLTYKLLVGVSSIDPLLLLSYLAPLAMVQMFALSCVFGEMSDIAHNWDRFDHLSVWSAVAATGFIAFLLNFTNFYSSKETSPLTVSVAGSIKEVATITLAYFLFGNDLTYTNLFGIVLSVIGATSYNYLSGLSKKETQQPTAKKDPIRESPV